RTRAAKSIKSTGDFCGLKHAIMPIIVFCVSIPQDDSFVRRAAGARNRTTGIASRHKTQSIRLNTPDFSPFSALAYETTTVLVVILPVTLSSHRYSCLTTSG